MNWPLNDLYEQVDEMPLDYEKMRVGIPVNPHVKIQKRDGAYIITGE